MKSNLIVRLLLLGFLSWLIPFGISFLFYRPGGELIVPCSTFKSFMIVVGTMSGCLLLVQYFKLIRTNFIKHAIIVGSSWLAINLVLDSIILIPMMRTSFVQYLMSIGLGYLAIPSISITIGYLLRRQASGTMTDDR